MSYNNDPMGAALDRYITGNWGEDSVPQSGVDHYEGEDMNECSACGRNGSACSGCPNRDEAI